MTFRQLLRRFGSAHSALKALPELTARGSALPRFTIAPERSIEQELSHIRRFGAQMITWQEDAYPDYLKAIPDPPPVITVLGPLPFGEPGIAIVGARNASSAGRKFTAQLVINLGEHSIRIISGLARGIDGAAHTAALLTGTTAVLAGGIDQVYPPEHRALYDEIRDNGLLVSEVAFGHVARARDFPKRNRIVSGLSAGVVVVEAAERSGTLITARMALEQNREVFAVPGSPLDPRSVGANKLIRDGATLIRHADDIIEALGGLQTPSPPPSHDLFSEETTAINEDTTANLRDEILTLLSYTPIHQDEIIREIGAQAYQVSDALLELCLEGAIDQLPGGGVVLAS